MKIVSVIFFNIVVICMLCHLYSMDNETVNVQLRTYVKENNQEKVRTLLEKKVDINAFSKKGSNPLIIAIYNDNIEMIKILLDYGANPCAEYERHIDKDFFHYFIEKDLFFDCEYYYPIIEAVKHGNFNCLKMLIIDYEVDLFFIEKNKGWFSFDYLVENNHQSCVKMILKHAHEIDLRNFSQLSLIDYFKSLPDSGYKKLLGALIKYFLLLKKHYQRFFSKIPKPLIFIIIKLSIDPYCPMLHELLEKKRIKSPFSENNVRALARTEEMKNVLLQYKKFLNIPKSNENSQTSYSSYFCYIS